MKEGNKKKKDKSLGKSSGGSMSGRGEGKGISKKKKVSDDEKIKRRSETIEVLRNLSKAQHNDQYELRSLLNVKLGEISSVLQKFSKDLDVKLEEEFISLKGAVQSGMENLSDYF